MVLRNVIRQSVVSAAASILWAWGMVGPEDAFAGQEACRLLSAGEIEAVVGEKVTFHPASAHERCNIQIGNGPDNLMVHLVKKAKPSKEAEEYTKQGEEEIKKRGIKTTIEKQGNTTCTTSAPPHPPQKIGSPFDLYSTSCVFKKGELLLILMIYRTSEKKMVPVSRLRPLAEKAASRL